MQLALDHVLGLLLVRVAETARRWQVSHALVPRVPLAEPKVGIAHALELLSERRPAQINVVCVDIAVDLKILSRYQSWSPFCQ